MPVSWTLPGSRARGRKKSQISLSQKSGRSFPQRGRMRDRAALGLQVDVQIVEVVAKPGLAEKEAMRELVVDPNPGASLRCR